MFLQILVMNQNTYYHQKLAEQLILLTTHGKGLLARVYHLRKVIAILKSFFSTIFYIRIRMMENRYLDARELKGAL